MTIPLIVSGKEISHNPFRVKSPFYPGAGYDVAAAGPLDVAAAIGSVRKVRRASLADRVEALKRAAREFTYTPADLEHAVWVTGMPVSQIQTQFDQIKQWFLDVPRMLSDRLVTLTEHDPLLALSPEILAGAATRRFSPVDGFCYAVTPGNDPRASALVAANLACYGIPFIIRASPKDTTAPLIIRALLQAGIDPNSCNLLYFAPGSGAAFHARLIDASRVVWTHGPASLVDTRLRYVTVTGDPTQDRFQGKLVIRHHSGASAFVLRPPLDGTVLAALYESIAYPLGCAAARSLFAIGDLDWEEALTNWLACLRVGDPLDPFTQIGYIEADILDQMQQLVQKNHLRSCFWGGDRISAIQSTPLLVAGQEDANDFFTREVPAYVLALRRCSSLEEAVGQLNHNSGDEPRLSIACHHLAPAEIANLTEHGRTHAILVEGPTTTTLPVFHEGNDYFHLLHRQKIIL